MGTSSLPSPVCPSPLSLPPLYSPLDDLLAGTSMDHFSAQSLPHDGLSSTTASPSSYSSSSDCSQRRSFLHSSELGGPLSLQAHSSFSQIGSPVLSGLSFSKGKPVSPLNNNGGWVSPMISNSIPNSNTKEALQAFHGGSSHLANSIVEPLEEITSSCISSILTSPSPSPSLSPSAVALSSPASTGATATKVSKRRARVNKKTLIPVLSADPSNFRAMVQQLTGIPPSTASPRIWGSSGAPLLRPQPTRFAHNGGLRLLDTSVPFLGPRQFLPLLQNAQQPLMNGLSSSQTELNSSQGRGSWASYDTSSLTSIQGVRDAVGSGMPNALQMNGNVKELSAENLLKECEKSFPRQASSLIESLLTPDEDVLAKSPLNAVDSWLAFDAGAGLNFSSMVDLAKIAS